MAESRRKDREIVGRPRATCRNGRGLLQALFAIVVVILGIVGAIVLIKLKKPIRRIEQDVQAPLVKVEQLYMRDIPMIIQGYGTVNPKVEVDIVPEVSGKVVYIHPELKVGGLIRGNEQILQIDPRDYELAVRQADAAVIDARVKLETEQAEADVARKEWSELHPGSEPTSPLVLREPQIRKAKAMLESAEAQFDVAKLRLERTGISLPFDVLVTSEKVDLGQYVVIGQPLARAYGTDAVEIEVPLEDDELAWFDVFENSIFADSQRGSFRRTPAEVRADFAGTKNTWDGYVVRTTGQVDRTSRMISVVVEVVNPFKITNDRSPLLPGVFAEVLIEGRILRKAIAVPRDAIREGSKVWLVNDNRLYIQPLDIVRADKDFAYIVSDVDNNANVVISSLDTVIEGMKVRTQADIGIEGEQVEQDIKQSSSPEGR